MPPGGMPLCLLNAGVGHEHVAKSKITYTSSKASTENCRNRVVYTWLERKPDRYDYLPELQLSEPRCGFPM